jgi:hypothetical protein
MLQPQTLCPAVLSNNLWAVQQASIKNGIAAAELIPEYIEHYIREFIHYQ